MFWNGDDDTIIFDGDDTLWGTQELYEEAKAHFFALLAELGHTSDVVASKLAEIDVANVDRFGFSRQRFPMSMRETYESFCRTENAPLDSRLLAQIAAIGDAVFDSVPIARPQARRVLERLRRDYRLILFTAGDTEVQRLRVEQSALGQYFDQVVIVAQKTDKTWRALVRGEDLVPSRTWSIGNSVRSDINPALELGLRCVVVVGPTWEYERAKLNESTTTRSWHAATLDEAAQIVTETDKLRAIGNESVKPLLVELERIRGTLESKFAPDTAYPGTRMTTPSAGHCAVTAAIVQQHLGGELVSTCVDGESHWFNRVPTPGGSLDVDITGDQFGRETLQVAAAGRLYPSSEVRPFTDLIPETLDRAARLAERAGMPDVAAVFRRESHDEKGGE